MSLIRREPLSLTRWEPFREIEDMFRRYSPFSFGRAPSRGSDEFEWAPIADVSETDGEYLIKAELPEVKKEDVSITLQDGVITIAGERRREQEQKDENQIRVESFYGRFSRSFSLPDDVDVQAIRAESRDGVLRVHIPKTQAQAKKPVSIEIQ